MAEYIEREDALKIADEYYDHPIGKGIAKSIFCLPAANVRPVVRGKWEPWSYKGYGILPFSGLKCSKCGVLMDGIEKPEEYHLNFCPNCGADMREES